MLGATSRSPVVLRKIGGAFDACRHVLRRSPGSRRYTPSLMGALSAVAAIVLLPLVLIAIMAALLSFAPAQVASASSIEPTAIVGLAMGTTVKELIEKRRKAHEAAQVILKVARDEKRELTAEENNSVDKAYDDVDAATTEIEKQERRDRTDAELARSRGRGTQEDERGGDDPNPETPEARKKAAEERQAQHDEAFGLYLRYGIEGLNAEQRAFMQSTFRRPEGAEQRAPQTVTTTGGGYLIPQGFSNQLEESLKAFGGVEQAADVFTTETGNPLPWPTVDDTAQTGALLAINVAAAEQAVTYGVVNFEAHKFSSKLVLVPVELMQDSAFDVNGHLAGVLGVRLGRVHNTYQTTGTGSAQPQGIATAASSALTAVSATTVTLDEMIDLEHSIDPAYRNAAFGVGYMFNDGTLKILRKLKDGDGRPLWQPGMAGGAPNTINGWPYHINQDVAAMTTGNKAVLFGALKKFKVRKVKEVTLLRLVERYAELHQIGFLAFTRMDSRMLDAGTDPVKAITMA